MALATGIFCEITSFISVTVIRSGWQSKTGSWNWHRFPRCNFPSKFVQVKSQLCLQPGLRLDRSSRSQVHSFSHGASLQNYTKYMVIQFSNFFLTLFLTFFLTCFLTIFSFFYSKLCSKFVLNLFYNFCFLTIFSVFSNILSNYYF